MRRSTSSSKRRGRDHSATALPFIARRPRALWASGQVVASRSACSGVVPPPAAAHVSIMLSRLYAALGVSKKRKAEDVPESKKRQATHLPESPRAVPASPAQLGASATSAFRSVSEHLGKHAAEEDQHVGGRIQPSSSALLATSPSNALVTTTQTAPGIESAMDAYINDRTRALEHKAVATARLIVQSALNDARCISEQANNMAAKSAGLAAARQHHLSARATTEAKLAADAIIAAAQADARRVRAQAEEDAATMRRRAQSDIGTDLGGGKGSVAAPVGLAAGPSVPPLCGSSGGGDAGGGAIAGSGAGGSSTLSINTSAPLFGSGSKPSQSEAVGSTSDPSPFAALAASAPAPAPAPATGSGFPALMAPLGGDAGKAAPLFSSAAPPPTMTFGASGSSVDLLAGAPQMTPAASSSSFSLGVPPAPQGERRIRRARRPAR